MPSTAKSTTHMWWSSSHATCFKKLGHVCDIASRWRQCRSSDRATVAWARCRARHHRPTAQRQTSSLLLASLLMCWAEIYPWLWAWSLNSSAPRLGYCHQHLNRKHHATATASEETCCYLHQWTLNHDQAIFTKHQKTRDHSVLV